MYAFPAMPAVRQKTKPVSFRTSDQVKLLIEAIAAIEFGGNQTSAIEAALIFYARRKNIQPLPVAAAVSETKAAYSTAPASEAGDEGK